MSPDRAAAERTLQKAGLPFDHNKQTIAVHSDSMRATVVDELRRDGWHVQEIRARRITLAPSEGPLAGLGL